MEAGRCLFPRLDGRCWGDSIDLLWQMVGSASSCTQSGGRAGNDDVHRIVCDGQDGDAIRVCRGFVGRRQDSDFGKASSVVQRAVATVRLLAIITVNSPYYPIDGRKYARWAGDIGDRNFAAAEHQRRPRECQRSIRHTASIWVHTLYNSRGRNPVKVGYRPVNPYRSIAARGSGLVRAAFDVTIAKKGAGLFGGRLF